MPYKSEKQRRFMWAKHPEIAQRWEKEGKGHVEGKDGKRRMTGVRGKISKRSS